MNVIVSAKKQWTCKPGSVHAPKGGACHLSTTRLSPCLPAVGLRPPASYRSTLRLGRAALSPWCCRSLCGARGLLGFAGLRELSASGVHSTHVAMCLVGSCPTFSPLPSPDGLGGLSLLHVLTLAGYYLLGSGVPCAARTFL